MRDVGTVARLYFDGMSTLEDGDVLERPFRRYVVCHVRVQTKGKHAGRQHVIALVAEDRNRQLAGWPDELAQARARGRVFRFEWQKRRRRGPGANYATRTAPR
jgi:hypothetical protein